LASILDNLDYCKVLIENSANVNAVNLDGCSALFYSKDLEIFNYLIKSGARIDIKDSFGSTMLHFTVEMKKLRLYIELLKLGIDSGIRNLQGFTALDLIMKEYKAVKGFGELRKRKEIEIVEELVRRKF
jgi:ankyrin repeat protein